MSVLKLELRRMTSAERTKAPAFFDKISTLSNRIILQHEVLRGDVFKPNTSWLRTNMPVPLSVCLLEVLGRTAIICHKICANE